VIQPTAQPAARSKAQGSLAPLVEFIHSLPPDRTWDAEAFARLPQSDRFARERAEVFWLQLLDLLRKGGEKDAAELLRGNRFRGRSWRPELELALGRILHFRVHGSLAATDVASTVVSTNGHPFFQELERLAIEERGRGKATPVSADFRKFLKGGNAFAAAFLAAGWREAALGLAAPKAAEPVPGWFHYGFAQSLRFNRGTRPALDYLSDQSPTDEVIGLRGELLLADGRFPEASAALQSVATHDSDAGFRSAWLLAQRCIESNDLAGARRVIEGQRRLASSITGRELLARLVLSSGDAAGAERMYQAIANESVEAGAVLARRAFERKDWATARRHTEALMRRMPDELQLRENLFAIDQAEKANANR
jgi:hypothetical protein